MEKAVFDNIRSEIIPLLDNAKDKVLVAMAWFTSDELFKALLSCLERGVSVELIILDNSINYMYYAPDFNELIERGGKLRIAGLNLGFMHHKFCVIDGIIAITGSYNWTYYAETRNIENIIITDVLSIVSSYKEEFNRLVAATQLAAEVPRLSWEQIEDRQDVDFRELNYEIGSICKAKNLPIQNVIKTETKVQIIETKRIPYSSCSFGVIVLDKNDNEKFKVFIKEHVKLPYSSDTIELYFDSKNEKEHQCSFVFGSPEDPYKWFTIKQIDILQIAQNANEENLPIYFSMHLDIDGHLRVDVLCNITGKTLRITIPDTSFVKYE